jgi:hypothetical protein
MVDLNCQVQGHDYAFEKKLYISVVPLDFKDLM